jgi:hypothetical protein
MGLVGHRTSLVAKRKIFVSAGGQTHLAHPIASRYTDEAHLISVVDQENNGTSNFFC